jgi:hypothetical protein
MPCEQKRPSLPCSSPTWPRHAVRLRSNYTDFVTGPLHRRAEQRCKPRMSHGIRSRCDIATLACRSTSLPSATLQPSHVAPDPFEVRHCNPRMSLDKLAKCDIATLACRSTSLPSATLQPSHVAPDPFEVRHCKSRMSHGMLSKCDIATLACRRGSLRSATLQASLPQPGNIDAYGFASSTTRAKDGRSASREK